MAMASRAQIGGDAAPPPLQGVPPESHDTGSHQEHTVLDDIPTEPSEQARQASAMKNVVLQKIGENDRQYRQRHSLEHQQHAQPPERRSEQHPDQKQPRSAPQISDYRQQLARETSLRARQTPESATAQARKRPSPIEEERTSVSGSPSMPASGGSSGSVTSTSSSHTVRGTPAPTTNTSSRTPSYPFPRMASSSMTTPSLIAARNYPTRSTQPEVGVFATTTAESEPDNKERAGRPVARREGSYTSFRSDQVLSSPSTPASGLTFLPTNEQNDSDEVDDDPKGQPQGDMFSDPNLYDLSLALAAEPGLDAWWNSVVQIATEWYKAERVALVVPADSTDVENMPWGQKATYNTHGKDDGMSLGYIGHSGSHAASTADIGSEPKPAGSESPGPPPSPKASGPPRRPKLTSRYSYTAYEDHKGSSPNPYAKPGESSSTPRRPAVKRSQTSHHVPKRYSDVPQPQFSFASLDRATLEKHDAAQGSQAPVPHWEEHFHLVHETRGRVLPVIQALDYEADPLIDHLGVRRVLDRGRAVALTRSYPYLDHHGANESGQQQKQSNTSNQLRSESATKRLSGGNATPSRVEGASAPHKEPQRPVQFEEYEQIPPSSWSQSPAPSPAVRSESTENPFFNSAVVDEESFNPGGSQEDYTKSEPPETIGVDNSWTVLHVPLFHPLLSKPNPVFKLDTAKMERKSSPQRKPDKNVGNLSGSKVSSKVPSPEPPNRPRQMPIAILSILSPVIPYPSHLCHSLEHLAPHMATTFSLCLHHTNLEAEVSGLNRRRRDLGGFGAIDTEGRPLTTSSSFANTPYMAMDDAISHRSISGSITSFSDYSGPSRSWMGSPGVTPGWDAASLNLFFERRMNAGIGMSPSIASITDGYFGARPAALSLSHLGRPVTTPGGSSSGGGGNGGGIAVQRARKSSSAAQHEKRLTALRQPAPESMSQAREPSIISPHTTLSPEFPSTTPATVRTTSSMQNESGQIISQERQDVVQQQGQQVPINLTDSGAVSASAQTPDDVDGRPTTAKALSTASSDISVALDQKLSAVVKDVVSDDTKSTTSDRIPLPSPYTSNPTSQSHQRQQQQQQQQQQHQHQQRRSRHRYSNSHGNSHSQLHSYGADFASTFPLLPPSSSISVKAASVNTALLTSVPSRAGSVTSSNPVDMPPPSDRLKSLILDALPTHVFVALPQTGAIVWVNSRYLAYRGQTVESLAEDPWASIHPDDRDEYLKAWSQSVRTGDQFSRTVRIRRFDGDYRWFQARAVASRDRRNSIMQFLGSYMDIHDQHIAELKAARQEEIEASEIKHRILANLIPQIIFTANEEEGVTFANEQWQRYTGQPFEKLLGLGFLDFVHPDDLANCSFLPVPQHLQKRRQRLQQALSSSLPSGRPDTWSTTRRNSRTDGEEGLSELAELARRGIIMVTTDDNGRPSYTTEVRVRSKTGEYRWHLVRCVETGTVDFGKGHNSYFGSATDINDHKLLETKLKEAMESKTRFLSNMSHEIRTPLIGISGMVSFLQDTTLNEEQRDYTNTIQTSANSLLMIINDILDLSKVDAGMMKLSFEWFHTRSLIEDVNELVSTMAIAKGLELNYIVEADVPGWVKGDRVRIRQVLLNVIGNAIKFTAHGEVFSRCRVFEHAPSPNKIALEFSVTDTGRGFTKEEAELIFKPFSQIDGSSTRQHGGSGLGLVISRQLVELHGGKMEGTAEPGKGSTFTFTALFGLPTEFDHPDSLATSFPPSLERLNLVANASSGATQPSPASAGSGTSLAMASDADSVAISSPTANSSGSSDPSIHPGQPPSSSDRLPLVSSNNKADFAIFSRAAQASGQGLSDLKLEVPSNNDTMTSSLAISKKASATQSGKPLLSILVICPQTHSREATAQHIEMTLPKELPHRITTLATAAEAQQLVKNETPESFTHVVINLPSPQEIIDLVDQLDRSTMLESVNIVVLSDSVQRQAVNKLAAGTRFEELLSDSHVTYIYKPVKPSRFAVIFDPAKERDVSIDRNRSNAQRLVETQKQSYLDLEQRMGNKGYKVLLVEDNPVNQKVLKKYLLKVGVEVDMASDGEECTEAVLSRPHDYYALILCDLHMPRKDGYQACREIRQWEAAGKNDKQIPIIALSANVMSDVHDKCVAAGFNKYITKPVDFIDLSRVLSDFF